MEDDILTSTILESDKKTMAFTRKPKPHKAKKEKEVRITSITPVDNSTLTPRKAFEYM